MESAVVLFEVKEGTERGHVPETDLTRCHQVLDVGDKLKSSIFRLDTCCFLAILTMDTHLLQALWQELILSLVGFYISQVWKHVPEQCVASCTFRWYSRVLHLAMPEVDAWPSDCNHPP